MSDGMENRLKGLGKEIEGKVRNAVGGLTGDTSEQLHGKATELEGRGQQKVGEVQDRADNDGMENQVRGAFKEAGGKIRNAVGAITGDSSEQLKGKADELEGTGQRKVGEAESRIG